MGLTWGAASILGPVLGTRLYAWSPDGFWSLCVGLGAVAAGLALIGREPVRVVTGIRASRREEFPHGVSKRLFGFAQF